MRLATLDLRHDQQADRVEVGVAYHCCRVAEVSQEQTLAADEGWPMVREEEAQERARLHQARGEGLATPAENCAATRSRATRSLLLRGAVLCVASNAEWRKTLQRVGPTAQRRSSSPKAPGLHQCRHSVCCPQQH